MEGIVKILSSCPQIQLAVVSGEFTNRKIWYLIYAHVLVWQTETLFCLSIRELLFCIWVIWCLSPLAVFPRWIGIDCLVFVHLFLSHWVIILRKHSSTRLSKLRCDLLAIASAFQYTSLSMWIIVCFWCSFSFIFRICSLLFRFS